MERKSLTAVQQYPAEYLDFIRLFNSEKFFEAHEILEDLWRRETGTVRPFYQGLIQAAASCVHLQRRNFQGAKQLCESSLRYLSSFAPYFMGLQIVKFTDELNSAQLAQSKYPRIYLN